MTYGAAGPAGKVSKSTPKHLSYASWSCASTHNLILYDYIHTSVIRSTFGTLARSQFCWHKFGQFWIRLKHNLQWNESSESSFSDRCGCSVRLWRSLTSFVRPASFVAGNTQMLPMTHTHTTPHTGSRLASCAELFFLQANENIKTWKVPPNLGAGNTLRVGLRNPCLDHLRGCLFIHWLLRFNV